MADVTNTYSALIDKIFAAAIVVIRENSVLPRLVSNYSDLIAARPGSTVDIPDQPTITTRAVAPDATAADPSAQTWPTTQLVLNNWREAPFVLSDKEQSEVIDGAVPRAINAAGLALASYIDAQGMALYKTIYNCGAPDPILDGTTPVDPAFAIDATNNPTGFRAVGEAGTLLDQWGAPANGRVVVLAPKDNWDASFLGPVLKANERGNREGIQDRNIGHIIGMDWWMDQAVTTHTAGTIATTAGQAVTSPALTAGDTSGTFGGTITTALTAVAGDIFKFASHNQTYTIVTTVTSTTNSLVIASGGFQPPVKVNVLSAVAIEFLPSHKVNLMFHPDGWAFASRPLSSLGAGNYRQVSDPVSGLTLRLEVTRQNKRDLFSLDCLFGWKLAYPKLVARIASQI